MRLSRLISWRRYSFAEGDGPQHTENESTTARNVLADRIESLSRMAMRTNNLRIVGPSSPFELKLLLSYSAKQMVTRVKLSLPLCLVKCVHAAGISLQ